MSMRDTILLEIEAFLAETGLSESYFGALAAGNSKLVKRLRAGSSIRSDTVDKLRSFIRSRRDMVRSPQDASCAIVAENALASNLQMLIDPRPEYGPSLARGHAELLLQCGYLMDPQAAAAQVSTIPSDAWVDLYDHVVASRRKPQPEWGAAASPAEYFEQIRAVAVDDAAHVRAWLIERYPQIFPCRLPSRPEEALS